MYYQKPTTPRKRKSTAAKDDEEGSPKKKLTPAKSNGNMKEDGAAKKTKAPTAKARPIPTNIETASSADKGLLRMRDQEKADWATIAEFWKQETGEDIPKGTLAKRYSRLKQNIQVWKEGDVSSTKPRFGLWLLVQGLTLARRSSFLRSRKKLRMV